MMKGWDQHLLISLFLPRKLFWPLSLPNHIAMDRKEGHKIQPFISFMSIFLAALSYAAQSESDSSHTAPTPASEQHL